MVNINEYFSKDLKRHAFRRCVACKEVAFLG